MENSILVTLSAQSALRRRLDVVANNLANASTTGFKREQVLFAAHLPPPSIGVVSRGGRPVMVRDTATVADHAQGRLERTDNPLDVAIRGDGYFVIETAGGNRYTRDGHFRLDPSGRLVTEDGDPVLDAGGGPIVIGPENAQIAIAADGTLSSELGELGRLNVVRFDRPQSLEPAGGGLWWAADVPQAVEYPSLVQGMLESSNVQPIQEINDLIRVHRAYDQAKQFTDREDERIRKMLQAYAA